MPDVGAAVMLNSGGPNMLIRNIADGFALCIWVNENKIEEASFNLKCLTLLGDVNITIG